MKFYEVTDDAAERQKGNGKMNSSEKPNASKDVGLSEPCLNLWRHKDGRVFCGRENGCDIVTCPPANLAVQNLWMGSLTFSRSQLEEHTGVRIGDRVREPDTNVDGTVYNVRESCIEVLFDGGSYVTYPSCNGLLPIVGELPRQDDIKAAIAAVGKLTSQDLDERMWQEHFRSCKERNEPPLNPDGTPAGKTVVPVETCHTESDVKMGVNRARILRDISNLERDIRHSQDKIDALKKEYKKLGGIPIESLYFEGSK